MTYFFIGSAAVLAIVLAISWYRMAYKTACSGDLTRVGAPLVIFDFDGTICPSYPLFIEQVNFLADEFNLRKIEDDEIDKFRSMNPKSIMKHLGISMFKLPFFLKKARRNVQNQLFELKPVPGVTVVLQELRIRKKMSNYILRGMEWFFSILFLAATISLARTNTSKLF